MKIYLSGPMTGLPNKNKEKFERASELWKNVGYAVINPHDIVPLEPNFVYTLDGSPEYYGMSMRADLIMLLHPSVSAIYMMQGWEQSRGARVEHAVASICGLKIFYEGTS